jgi:hypothetical protein
MLRLTDRSPLTESISPPGGIELPPLREPDALEVRTPYVPMGGARVMTSKELADERSAGIPPTPRFDRFGERVSHITDRFVLSGCYDAYRIWRFQSAEPAIEFPVTEEGWALAWNTFRSLHSSAA